MVAIAIPRPNPQIAVHVATNPIPEERLVVVPRMSPAPIAAKPKATVSFVPRTLAIMLAGSAPARSPPMRGRSRTPEPIAVVPRTPWKYWGSVNSTPNIARIATAARTTPHRYALERNSARSSSGSPSGRRLSRRSHMKKPAITTSPPVMSSHAPRLLQPYSPASINP
ncbi:MAG: hypothetical protein ABSA53_40330 [Streptosporangiaceae bacterium]